MDTMKDQETTMDKDLHEHHTWSPRRQQQTQIGEDTCDPLPRKDPITGRRPPFLIGPPQRNEPFLERPYRRNRPKEFPTSKTV